MANILVLATQNEHKIFEIQHILSSFPVEIAPVQALADGFHVIEDGATFEENALKKAREAHRLTGLPSMADDSGLEVDALQGRPGVFSSRFAGIESNAALNNRKLLDLLDGRPHEDRSARFRTVIAFVRDGGGVCVSGACEGFILDAPQGSGGFGYDPLFYYPESGKSFAELSADEKNRVSHRGRALIKIAPVLKDYFGNR